MKYFIYVLYVLAAILLVVNVTKLDFNAFFEGDSLIALIGIVSILCGVCVLLIYQSAVRISKKK